MNLNADFLTFEIDSEGDRKMDDAAMRSAASGASSIPSLPIFGMAVPPSSTSTGLVIFKFSPAHVLVRMEKSTSSSFTGRKVQN
jgi:hypothetical protein